MTICDIDHLHKRFLDIWEWCMRQGFDTRAFTYVENAFKSEPTAELVDHKTEPTISKMEQVDKDINVRSKDEPQTGEMMTEEEFDSMLARVLTGNNEPQTERKDK